MTDLAALKARYPGAITFKFGDSAEMSAEILPLVFSGKKTATCAALREYEAESASMPVIGRRDIALAWDDTPVAVIETTDVTQCRFDDVGEDFARAEGEFPDYASWREAHRVFFDRHGGWSPDMMLVCERFRLIEVIE
ncbi:MAG: ASCH domain-containing protein [Pseudomonadota bacterium]